MRTLISWAGDDPFAKACSTHRVASSEPMKSCSPDIADIPGRRWRECSPMSRAIPTSFGARHSFYSNCERHIMPFFGKAHIGYYPSSGVVGLSKLARLVEIYARRMQTQEAMTSQIVAAIETHLKTRGVAALIEAEHACLAMRGVEKQGSKTVTMLFTGVFRDNREEQARFFQRLSRAPWTQHSPNVPEA